MARPIAVCALSLRACGASGPAVICLFVGQVSACRGLQQGTVRGDRRKELKLGVVLALLDHPDDFRKLHILLELNSVFLESVGRP